MAKPIVAFQGEHGAYSEEAVRQKFGDHVETLPKRSFADIFSAIEGGEADYGVLPVENSVAGSINQAYDLLLERDLRVVGEICLRVKHCLMAPRGTKLEDIRVVRSHPQALAQCERTIREHGWEAEAVYDTAGSAKALAESPEEGIAAIASALAAEIYNLDILVRGIEDMTWNTTRFFVLGNQEAETDENSKTSLVFAVPHRPGALVDCLSEFARRGLNLTKLESRPRRNRPWHYVFYLDCEGHWQEPGCQAALMGLLSKAAFVKLLGSYPAECTPGGIKNGD